MTFENPNTPAKAYGLEVMLKKNTGKLTGWLSYTLAKAEQRIPGRNAGEPGINNGAWYRSNYDRSGRFYSNSFLSLCLKTQ